MHVCTFWMQFLFSHQALYILIELCVILFAYVYADCMAEGDGMTGIDTATSYIWIFSLFSVWFQLMYAECTHKINLRESTKRIATRQKEGVCVTDG